jgi:hypothetical protein
MRQKHTPGPWGVGGNSRAPTVVSNAGTICDLMNKQPETERVANARLIAAAPDLLAELLETAVWLIERAGVLRDLAGGVTMRKVVVQTLRDEAARLDGRAAVIRQAILIATGG